MQFKSLCASLSASINPSDSFLLERTASAAEPQCSSALPLDSVSELQSSSRVSNETIFS